MKRLILIVLVLTSICLNAWAKEDKKSVSIFVHASDFKTAIAEKVRTQLVDYDVLYYGIEQLLSEDSLESDIVLIINQTQWLKPNKQVIKFVEGLSDEHKARVIVLSTAGTKGKNIKVPGVDSITSASEMNRVNELSDIIVSKIKDL